MLSSKTKVNYIKKVIQSCKTPIQLETCQHWIFNIRLHNNIWDDYRLRSFIDGYIKDQKVYINKLQMSGIYE